MSFGRTFFAVSGTLLAAAIAGPVAGQDLERGKEVYERIGNCRYCHGWDGAGLAKNPRAPGLAANLRESGLDAVGLDQIIQCGLPGTSMPYHDQNAYKDDRCYGLTSDDFEPGEAPDRGEIFRAADREDLVAYLLEYVVGQGETTLEDCERFYSKGHDNCARFEE